MATSVLACPNQYERFVSSADIGVVSDQYKRENASMLNMNT